MIPKLLHCHIQIYINNFVQLLMCTGYRYIGVGLSASGVNLSRQPGWEKNSYGYHADDGYMFSSSGTGQKYGPTFTTADVVGCGFNLVDRSIFFTKNGITLGTAVAEIAVSSLHIVNWLIGGHCDLGSCLVLVQTVAWQSQPLVY